MSTDTTPHDYIDAFSDPSVTGPNLLFGTGKAVNGVATYQTTMSSIDGGVDTSWSIGQWTDGDILNPSQAQVLTNIVDPVLGTEIASFSTPTAGFDVYKSSTGVYTYALTSENSPGSLQDTYLSSVTNASGAFTFDHQMTFTMLERISSVTGDPSSPTMVQNDVTVAFNNYNNPNYNPNLPTFGGFLQFPIAASWTLPQGFQEKDSGSFIFNIGVGADNSNTALTWKSDNGAEHSVTIDLSSAVVQLAEWLAKVDTTSGVGSNYLNLSLWSLTGTYNGVEAGSSSGATVDITDPRVTMDKNSTFTIADAKTTVETVSGGETYAQMVSPTMTGVGTPVTVTGGLQLATLFSNIDIETSSDKVTVSVTSSNAAAGKLYETGFIGTVSTDGLSYTYANGAGIVERGLDNLQFIGSGLAAGDTEQTTISVLVTDAQGYTVSATENVTVVGQNNVTTTTGGVSVSQPVNYTFVDGYYVVGGTTSSDVATIDLSGETPTGLTTIFGGTAGLDVTGSELLVVLNGEGQNGATTVSGGGGDQVWAGMGSTILNASGHSEVILASMSKQSESLVVNHPDAASTTQVDVWGNSDETQTVTINGDGANTVFGGGSNLVLTSANTVYVDNGVGQTGTTAFQAEGNDTVWAGSGTVKMTDTAGSNTAVLTGSSKTSIDDTGNAGGKTTILSLAGNGQLDYAGGQTSASISLGSENATIALSSGAAMVAAGSANVTLTGGAGTLDLDLQQAASAKLSFTASTQGSATIYDFNALKDTASIANVVSSTVAATSGSLVVSLSNGSSITFMGVTDANHAGISFT